MQRRTLAARCAGEAYMNGLFAARARQWIRELCYSFDDAFAANLDPETQAL